MFKASVSYTAKNEDAPTNAGETTAVTYSVTQENGNSIPKFTVRADWFDDHEVGGTVYTNVLSVEDVKALEDLIKAYKKCFKNVQMQGLRIGFRPDPDWVKAL